ncbi:replication protein [Tyzzerella sp. OttesenSCG-928-J15]|nr:replication protein [Tyzzerella sp. OttesenSCG-928-J15]
MGKNKDVTNQKKYDERKKRYDEKRAGQRTRNWAVIFYPDDLPENWTSLVDELHVKWIQSPIHDNDFNADGKPKKPHYHTLFMFGVIKTAEQVEQMFIEIFGKSETDSIIGVAPPQLAIDRCAVVRYMAHMDNPDKAQYDVADIIGHNGADVAEVLKYSATETREMIVAMEEYIEENNIIELADFSKAIRYEYPEWHTIVATKMTIYFNAFIRSCRHKMNRPVKVVMVDGDGVVLDEKIEGVKEKDID